MFEWFGQVFQGIFDVLGKIGNAIIDLVNVPIVLIKFAGQAIMLIVEIIWRLVNLAIALGQGVIATIQSVSNPTWSLGDMSGGWQYIANILPLDTLGWIIAGIVWLIIAATALRLLREV